MMAASTNTSASKATSLNEHCAICHNRYCKPKLLNCLHSFCEHCLSEKFNTSARSSRASRVLTCPICMSSTDVPNGDVSKLVDNDALWARLALQTSLLVIKTENISRCQSCKKGAPLQARCLHDQCRHFLCASCVKAHQEMIVFQDHHLETVVEMRGREKASSSSSTKCPLHPKNALLWYCEPCRKCVCKVCHVEHSRSRHRVTKISESLPQYRESLEQMIPTLKRIATEFRNAAAMAEEYKRKAEQTASRAHIAKFMSQILLDSANEEFMKLYPQVSDVVENLKGEVPEHLPDLSIRNGREIPVEAHVDNQSNETPVKESENDTVVKSEALSEGSRELNDASDDNDGSVDTELPDLMNGGRKRSDSLGSMDREGEVSGFVGKQEESEEPMDENDTSNVAESVFTDESKSSSGRSESRTSSEMNHLWHRVGKIGGKKSKSARKFVCARGVSIGPNGVIAIADNRKNRVDIFDQNQEFMFSLKKPSNPKGKGTFRNAEDVAFNSIGHIFVIDKSKYVYDYSIEGIFVKKCSVLSPDLPPNTKVCSSCIAVDQQREHIFVGDCHRKLISIHDGKSLIRTIPELTMTPMYLAVNNHQELLVTDGEGSGVVKVEMSKSKHPIETQVFSVGKKVKVKVTGVVWNSEMDGFYVATLLRKRGQGQVHYCSRTGEHLETIVASKLNNPLGLALSSSNVLVVADMFSTKCYHRDRPEYSQSL